MHVCTIPCGHVVSSLPRAVGHGGAASEQRGYTRALDSLPVCRQVPWSSLSGVLKKQRVGTGVG